MEQESMRAVDLDHVKASLDCPLRLVCERPYDTFDPLVSLCNPVPVAVPHTWQRAADWLGVLTPLDKITIKGDLGLTRVHAMPSIRSFLNFQLPLRPSDFSKCTQILRSR